MEPDQRPHKRQRLEPDDDNGHPRLWDNDKPTDISGDSSRSVTNDDASGTHGIESGSDDPDLPSGKPNDDNATGQPSISKNQLKKLRRKEMWEAGRDFRKQKRKQKVAEKRERKRRDRKQADGEGRREAHSKPWTRHTQLPLTFLIDCGFDDLMTDPEIISLGSQITRAYSDNNKAQYKAHLLVSSFNGKLKNRFETVLSNQHLNWRDAKFLESDFLESSKQAATTMTNSEYTMNSGTPKGAFFKPLGELSGTLQPQGEIVYLSSESPNTLEELRPFSTYVVGGLVDRNRYKGLCYKTACDKGIRTAKLPISEYMEMQSRSVLATNHVIEIMLRWLECDNWGEAFTKVMPKRKGGSLKSRRSEEEEDETSIEHPLDHDARTVAECVPKAKSDKPPEIGSASNGARENVTTVSTNILSDI